MSKSSWRDVVKIHPAAEVFPLLAPAALKALSDDIKTNGLQVPIIVGLDPATGEEVLLDGRNRLDAAELAGEQTIKKGKLDPHFHRGAILLGGYDAAAVIVAANIRRRHLTKEQQAKLIVAAIKAGRNGTKLAAKNDSANLARSNNAPKTLATNDSANVARSFNPTKGKRGGSTKDPIKDKVIELASKEGISKRTVTRALVADRRAEVEQLLREGKSRDAIKKLLHVSPNTIAKIKRSMTTPSPDDTPASSAVPTKAKTVRNEDRHAKGILQEIEEIEPSNLSDPTAFGEALIALGKRFIATAKKEKAS